jgi:hypothetical protein
METFSLVMYGVLKIPSVHTDFRKLVKSAPKKSFAKKRFQGIFPKFYATHRNYEILSKSLVPAAHKPTSDKLQRQSVLYASTILFGREKFVRIGTRFTWIYERKSTLN